jgi:hypothetical protein
MLGVNLSWNAGPWGEQGNATVALTGIGLTTDLGQKNLGVN